MAVREMKLVLVGDLMTGKTSLVQRFASGKWSDQYKETIGADFTKSVLTIDGEIVILQIWDIAGRYRTSFSAVTRNYFRDATGVVVTFSLCGTDKSLVNAVDWRDHCLKVVPETVPCVLVGTKSDQGNENDQRIEDVVLTSGFHRWYKTSAKTGEGVAELFESLARMMVEHQNSERKPTKVSPEKLQLETPSQQKSSCKC